MKSARLNAFILVVLLLLYPSCSFAEIKPLPTIFSDECPVVHADIPQKGEKELKHVFSIATPDSNAFTQDAAVEIAMDVLLKQSAVIEKTPQSPDHYNFLLLEVEDRAISYVAHYVELSQESPAAYAWIITFFIADTSVYVGTVTVSSPAGEVIESSFGFIQQVTEIWEQEKGSEFFWSIEDQYLFDQLYKKRSWNYKPALPDEQDIPQDVALKYAIEAVAQKYNLSPQLLQEEYLLSTKFCYIDAREPSSRIWRVCFRKLDSATQQYELLYFVDISAIDGSILDVNNNTSGLG